jgi:hypothetical protein
MMSRSKKVLIGLTSVVAVGMAAFVAIPNAGAAHFNSLPAGTTVTAALKATTDMTFKGKINGVKITVTCANFSASGTVPSSPSDTMNLTGSPTINGCTDDLDGHDTIVTNTTNGPWTLTETSSSPYKMALGIPKAGAKFKSSILPSCVITTEPSAAGSVSGTYKWNVKKNTDSDTVKNASLATSGSGCTSTAAKTSATVILTPSPGAPPF